MATAWNLVGSAGPSRDYVRSSTSIASPPLAARRVQYKAALAISDLLSVAVGVGLAGFLRHGHWFDHRASGVLAVLMPLFVSLAFNGGAFDLPALQRARTGIRRALTALFTAALLLLGLGFAFKVSAEYSRTAMVTGTLLAALLMATGRVAAAAMTARLLPDGLVAEIVLVDGVSPLRRSCRALDARALGLTPSLDCPHALDRLGQLLHRYDRVFLSCAPEQRQPWIAALKGLGVEVHVMIPELEQLGVLGTGHLDHRLTAVVARGPLRRVDAVLKRGFDLAVAVFLLPALLLVTGLVAVAIKLDDRGPVFFRQTRIGQGNRLFAVLKFRSMRVRLLDAEGTTSTTRNDPRVTRVGQWLRRTSLDELPQLFNVFKGDMSIVGPRPHALGSTAADQLFWHVDRRYWLRHAVKPGLTGLAQVRGFRGATETADDLTNRIQADLEYMSGWSLWRDLGILVATLKVVFHRNAY